MKSSAVSLTAMVTILVGCAGSGSHLNPDGQPVKFSNPILGKSLMANARYVLLEKDIGTGKYKIVSMSKTRQAIVNARQERIVFSNDLTAFAPDFTGVNFYTYSDESNYGAQKIIMDCQGDSSKTEKYNPCNSDFGYVFVPMGVIKASAAGGVSSATLRSWEDPTQNNRRAVGSPEWALKQAGVFERLPELKKLN